jgi:hypothetical protein
MGDLCKTIISASAQEATLVNNPVFLPAGSDVVDLRAPQSVLIDTFNAASNASKTAALAPGLAPALESSVSTATFNAASNSSKTTALAPNLAPAPESYQRPTETTTAPNELWISVDNKPRLQRSCTL